MRNEPSMLDVQDIQERWVDQKDEYDAAESKTEEEQARIREDQASAMGQTGAGDADFDDMPMPLPSDLGVRVTRTKK